MALLPSAGGLHGDLPCPLATTPAHTSKFMSKKTFAFITIVSIALVLSSLPYILALIAVPSDRVFMGFISNPQDWAQYLSWMKASTRSVVIENMLTPEAQSPAFFNPQWFLLGYISQWLNWNYLPVLQLFRIASVLLFMFVTFKVCMAYFPQQSWAGWCAWLLVNFSSGLGWIWVVLKQITGEMRFPNDVFIAEPISFQNMIIYPHFLAAAVLILLTFWTFVMGVERERLRYFVASAGLGLVLGLTHAYDLIIIAGVLFVFLLLLIARDGFSWFPVIGLAIVLGISLPPAGYFYLLTSHDPVWKAVLAQFGNAGIFTPNPFHLIFLIGIPLLLVALTFTGLLPLAQKSRWQLLMRVWLVVNFFLLYIPADFQVHMLSGWQIPLGILAAEGLFHFLLPELRKRFGDGAMAKRALARFGPTRSKWLVVGIVALLVLPTNVYLLTHRMMQTAKLPHDHFLYKDEMAALQWLGQNTKPDDIVLGDLTVSQYVPGIAGNRVVLGHWAMSVDYYTKVDEIKHFYNPSTPDAERRALIDKYGARYVLQGRAERALGNLDLTETPYLSLVFDTPQTKIFKTVLE